MINTEDNIVDDNKNIIICGSGEMSKIHPVYIVKLHNESLKK